MANCKIERRDFINEKGENVIEYSCCGPNGESVPCDRWLEKSKNKWWCRINGGDKENVTGRGYIGEAKIPVNGVYEFEAGNGVKRTLGGSSNGKKWQDFMTEEEAATVAEIEAACRKRMNNSAVDKKRAALFAAYKLLNIYSDEEINAKIDADIKKAIEMANA